MVRYQALKNLYDVEKTIGSGGFAKVKLARHILTGEKVAIKIMDKSTLGDDYHRVKRELDALKSICHHHICKLYQVIETETHFFMVMEYCSGGELFDHIVEKNRLSEAESRIFFRQIVSAVAYLHKLGYAHRDLKPENILLDCDMNLKLIDFGLCAKPHGGMETYLQTSCGSPTYAAPELIRGEHYYGSEIDVWSMGVLLYALLCGFLPFDCDKIDSLYTKILNGKYDEPTWLSRESKRIINSMLQVQPVDRITIKQLMSHPWITAEIYEPVTHQSVHKFHEKDDEIICIMANYYNKENDEVWNIINKWSYDYYTATYLLLLNRKKQGFSLQIHNILRTKLRTTTLNDKIDVNCLKIGDNGIKQFERVVVANPKNIIKGTSDKHTSVLKKEKETISPRRSLRKRSHDVDLTTPIPVKKFTPVKETIMDSPCTSSNASTPVSDPMNSSNKLLYSIEKKILQVRNILTPRKKKNNVHLETFKPVILNGKCLHNVSTINCSNPDYVLNELQKLLSSKGINCNNKGYTVRGKSSDGKVSLELEVCFISGFGQNNLVGIRRKRLKGDSWAYKQICEEILKIAQKDLTSN